MSSRASRTGLSGTNCGCSASHLLMRRILGLAVGVLHILLAWVLISGVRMSPQVQTDTLVHASLWVAPETSEASPSTVQPRRENPSASSGPRTSSVASVVETLAESVPPSPELSSQEPLPVPAEAPAIIPKINVSMDAVVAASRATQQSDNNQRKDFSPLPTVMPKPCVPRKSSMEWNGKEDRRVTFSGPLPIIKLGKRCVVTIGMIGCNLGPVPEANSHLLDDMRSADRSRSSVPDPAACD